MWPFLEPFDASVFILYETTRIVLDGINSFICNVDKQMPMKNGHGLQCNTKKNNNNETSVQMKSVHDNSDMKYHHWTEWIK